MLGREEEGDRRKNKRENPAKEGAKRRKMAEPKNGNSESWY
jgi:hypothetical protein